MSDENKQQIIDENKQQIIDEYTSKVQYYDNLRDDITNLTKSINDMKANIKNTQQMQDRMKQQNYQVWAQLECKDTQTKTTEQKQASISDILEAFK